MRLKFIGVAAIAAIGCFASAAQAAVVTLTDIQTRDPGPGVANVALTTGGPTFGTSHANAPWTVNLTVSNQDLDGDAVFDDSFTFDLVASTTNANGISVWGQGINNSNGAGTNTSFGNTDGVSMSVQNVVGTTSMGDIVVFDGFTAVTIASGDGGAADVATQNRTIDVNGTPVSFNNTANMTPGFVFLQQAVDPFALSSTIALTNQGVANGLAPADGTLVIRQVSLQFSTVTAVPEPSSLAVASIIGLGVGIRMKRRLRRA